MTGAEDRANDLVYTAPVLIQLGNWPVELQGAASRRAYKPAASRLIVSPTPFHISVFVWRYHTRAAAAHLISNYWNEDYEYVRQTHGSFREEIRAR